MTDRDGASSPSTEELVGVGEGSSSRGPAVVRLAGRDRMPGRLTALLVIFVVVAIIKPWPAGGGDRPVMNPDVPPAPTATPTEDPLNAIRADCQDPPGWRTYSREAWSRGELRSWRSLQPATTASSPLDAQLPVVPFVAAVLELGFCAPWSGPERPPDGATVHVWQVVPPGSTLGTRSGAVELSLRGASSTLRLPFGRMFLPPDGVRGERAWPPGRYVFEIAGSGYERWWAVAIEPGDHPTGSDDRGGRAPSQPVP